MDGDYVNYDTVFKRKLGTYKDKKKQSVSTSLVRFHWGFYFNARLIIRNGIEKNIDVIEIIKKIVNEHKTWGNFPNDFKKCGLLFENLLIGKRLEKIENRSFNRGASKKK